MSHTAYKVHAFACYRVLAYGWNAHAGCGDGSGTKFWLDKWCGEATLKDSFPRLFRLESNKDARVSDRINHECILFIFNWSWAKTPKWRAESERNSLTSLLNAYAFSSEKPNEWMWKFNNFGRYTSKSLSSIFTEISASNSLPCGPTELNSPLPQKIGIFIWRAKQNKLPVRTELDNRDIDLNSTRCPVCDEDLETVSHTLLSCKFALDIWNRVGNWCNFGNINISTLADISKPFNPSLTSSTGASFWQAIVWVTSYYIWKNRNDLFFGNNTLSGPKIIAEIQSKSFEWIKSRSKKGTLEWHNWLFNPTSYEVDRDNKTGIG
ncbi:uncharacterized protein [Rutidosis leptorrhynchoides]|uniref:uncharacterized protein n=1 Tax=Rutidosis leptorrhynchoides TaxID=125765 RepID=UPI003A992AB5